MTSIAAQRTVVVVLAIVIVPWLAVSYRNSDKLEQASFVAFRPASTPAESAAALKDARSTGTLNPSRTDALAVEAALELHLGRPLAAAKLLDEMTRREPLAREPWFLLFRIFRTRDPARAARAAVHLKKLDPREARRQGI